MKITRNVLNRIDLEDINIDGSLIIPDKITEIDSEFIPHNVKHAIKSIIIPNSVTKIGDFAFSNLNLDQLIIPDSVTEIGKFLFMESNIKTIKLSNQLTTISDSTFLKTNIHSLKIPDSVISIGPFAFEGCKFKEETIVLPKSLKNIEKFAFSECSIKTIEIPASVEIINGGAFSECYSLEEVKLNEGLLKIKEDAFNFCSSLKSIDIPDTVTEIGKNVFANCLSLTNVKLSSNLRYIESGAFCECGLKQITIPSSVQYIYESAFENSGNLSKVVLSNGIIKIDDSAFKDCYKLKEINLPNTLEYIGNSAFSDCVSLCMVEIPSSVKEIKSMAFRGCKSLDFVSFDDGLEYIGEQCFADCIKLNTFNLPNSVKVIYNNAFPLENDRFYLTFNKHTKFLSHNIKRDVYLSCLDGDLLMLTNNNKINEAITFTPFNQDNIGVVSALFDEKEKVLKDLNNVAINCLYVSMLYYLDNDKFVDFYKTADKKFFVKFFNMFLDKLKNNDNITNNCMVLCKLIYNLGGFMRPQEMEIETRNGTKIQMVYMAQKVIEFLTETIKCDIISPDKVAEYFDEMEPNGFIQDFSRMFLDKQTLSKILEYCKHNNSFLSVCYNNFSFVQDQNKSHKGFQRQLKITYDMLVEYFEKKLFDIKKKGTEHIAQIIGRFHKNQEVFDNAVDILEEHQKNGIRDSIIKQNLLEEDIYDAINTHIQTIENNTKDIVNILNESIQSNYKYEWLKKNSAYNLVAGKLCDCCAHLEGVGIGLAIASVLHPNVQNLIIKDENGEMVAKATLYINTDEGYGVFNTVSVRTSLVKSNKQEEIYKKFKLGAYLFARQYNLENPEKPLKIITVGMNLNKLEQQIKKNHKKSKVLYKALHYGDFSRNRSAYEGDSFECQYIIWEENKNGRSK